MNFEKFKDYFHPSWHEHVKPFIESKECDSIYEFLKKESKRGKRIAPLSNLVYRCFLETSFDDIRVILIGMCPYHTAKNGVMVADGLLMGCSVTEQLQPSLEQFYGGIERELHNGLNLQYVKNPDLTYLARQGVLLYNAALTVELNKAGSHNEIWAPFTKYMISKVFSKTSAPILFLGREAEQFSSYIEPFTNMPFIVSHPASASYKNTEWDTNGVFGKINNCIKFNKKEPVEWLDDLPF